jgi:hypothetical protein
MRLMTAEQPPLPTDSQAIAAWVQYSKDRYDAAEKRIADFRGWARQLAAAIAVVVGLEAALLGQLGKLGEVSPLGMAFCLSVLLLGAALQVVLFGKAVKKGYVGQGLLGPESPKVIAGHVSTEAETRRMIGAYYAKAADESHGLAESVVKEVAGLAQAFTLTLWLLFVAMVLTAGLLGVSFARKTMANPPASSEPAKPQAGPASPSAPAASPAAEPAVSPLLVTPTPGRTETRAKEPVIEKLTATPTSGQRITEGREGKAK